MENHTTLQILSYSTSTDTKRDLSTTDFPLNNLQTSFSGTVVDRMFTIAPGPYLWSGTAGHVPWPQIEPGPGLQELSVNIAVPPLPELPFRKPASQAFICVPSVGTKEKIPMKNPFCGFFRILW